MQAALKVLYLITNRKRMSCQDIVGRTNGWKLIINAPTVYSDERVTNNF